MAPDAPQDSTGTPAGGNGSSIAADEAPGVATMAELDALLARAATEVQRGMDEGVARIGRYTLVTAVGEGGFGTVWLASQEEPVRRLVALKLLRRDPNSRMVMARFQNERQTLARGAVGDPRTVGRSSGALPVGERLVIGRGHRLSLQAAHSFANAGDVISRAIGRLFAMQGVSKAHRANAASVLPNKRTGKTVKVFVIVNPKRNVPGVPAAMALICHCVAFRLHRSRE
jgi:hypothetical protein